MPLAQGHRILAAAAALAVGVPVAAAAWIGQRTGELATHLGASGGVIARIGSVDADLTGTIRLSDVRLGSPTGDELFSAEAIEASVSLDSVLAGQFGADEIRVAGPRVSIEVDRDGDSDLARLVRRLAHAGTSHSGGSRVRRIVVASGTLTAHVAGIGDLTADDVELVPDAGGVRVITGRLRIHGGMGRVRGEIELARSAAEVTLPHVRFGRILAVAGTGTVTVSAAPEAGESASHDRVFALREVSIGRLLPGGALEVRAALDDAGVPRPIAAELSPRDLSLTLHGDRVPLRAFAGFAPHGFELDSARVTGAVTVRRTGPTVQLTVDGTVDGLRVDHHAITAQPITVAGSIHGRLSISPEAIAVDAGAIEIGAARWTGSGWLRRGAPVSGQLDLRLAAAPCAALMMSLPTEVRSPLDGMGMTGTFGGHAHLAIDLTAPPGEGVELSTELDNGCEVTAEPPASDVTGLAGPSDQLFADGSRARVGRGSPGWVELHRVPGFVPRAFTSAEDARFFDHHGFDITQIARSFEIDLRDHRLARGGSTISQQLVKNSFLTQRRSLDRKIQEAILTWRLESRLDKTMILERYLNVIELGPHLFGLRPAAQHWFGESPRELSVHQAAFLAALTSEPQSMSRRIRHAGGLDPDSAVRVDVILRAMRRDGVIDDDQLAHARETPLAFSAAVLRAEP